MRWTDGPHGPVPVQGVFVLDDGRVGYYRARGGACTVELWPPGTPWPQDHGLPDADGDEHDLDTFATAHERAAGRDADWDDDTADPILRAFLASKGWS